MKVTFTFGRIVPGTGKVITHQHTYNLRTAITAAELEAGPKIERPANHVQTRLDEIRAEGPRQGGA